MKMRISFIAVLCMAAVLSISSLATCEEDLLGWQETRWGMTAKEIEKLFAGAAKLREGDKKFCGYDVPVSIGGKEYRSFLRLDCNSMKLTHVSIGLKGMESKIEADSAFEELLKLLTLKYGKPGYEAEEHEGSEEIGIKARKTTKAWKFPTTCVELIYQETHTMKPKKTPSKYSHELDSLNLSTMDRLLVEQHLEVIDSMKETASPEFYRQVREGILAEARSKARPEPKHERIGPWPGSEEPIGRDFYIVTIKYFPTQSAGFDKL